MKNLFAKLMRHTIVQILSLLTGMQWICIFVCVTVCTYVYVRTEGRDGGGGERNGISCTYIKYGLLCEWIEYE